MSNDAEEELVREYFERVAVDYPPPLVLNVEPVSDSHRFLNLMVTLLAMGATSAVVYGTLLSKP